MLDKQIYSQNHTETPLISFVITDFNVSTSLLKECIESILALSLSKDEREIILIDDGSDESPLSELSDYADSIVYLRQPNQGVSAARNQGIKIAKGRYIQFVDGDDMLNPNAYEHCLDLIRYDNADMVLFEMGTKGESNEAFCYDEAVSGAEYMRHNNIHGSACSYVFSKSILGGLRFRRGVAYGEDEEFTPQLLLRAERVFHTAAKCYFYRQHSASMLHKKDTRSVIRRLDDTLGVIETLRNRLDLIPPVERAALQRRVDQLTMDYIYNVICLTRNERYLNRCLDRLRRKGLFPLPDRDYTRKYKWFRKLTNTTVGRKLLLAGIPGKK